MRPRGLYNVYCTVCFFFTLYICLCLIILLTIPSKRWETIVHFDWFNRMWISPSPGAYSMWNFCFLSILADFTSANEDFLRKSARSCSLTHTRMYSIIQLLLLGENMPRLLGATMLEKRENSRKLLHFYWAPLLVIKSERSICLILIKQNICFCTYRRYWW